MTIQEKIDRGVKIRAEIETLSKELKGIETEIKDYARAHPADHVPLGDPEREGRQYIARGRLFRVPIVLSADKIVAEVAQESEKAQGIAAAAGDQFGHFFKSVKKWENRFTDGKKFRDRADELLGEKAPAFVTACKALDKHGIPRSDVKIEWEAAAAEKKMEELGSGVAS